MIRFIHKNNGDVLEVVIGDTPYTPEQIKAALVANARMVAAIERLLALDSNCEYVDGEPAVCPGVGGPCHWCELRAAVGNGA